jgi:hypothetical protein
VYQSWHLHTLTPPYCQTWTDTDTYFHPAETSEEHRRKQKLPKSARIGPFTYSRQDGWKAAQKRHAAELKRQAEEGE